MDIKKIKRKLSMEWKMMDKYDMLFWFTILSTFLIAFISFAIIEFTYDSRSIGNQETMIGDTCVSSGKVMVFEYQGHKFINIIKVSSDDKQESFVIHDPDCRCYPKKLNNITTVITNNDTRNAKSTDSIMKANFRVVLAKLNKLEEQNIKLTNEIKNISKQKQTQYTKTKRKR